MDKALIQLYSQQQGGSIPFYAGYSRHQLGGSFLGGLLRFALPLFKSFGTSALKVAANTAEDVVNRKRPLKEAMYSNFKREIKRKAPQFDDSDTIYKQSKPTQRKIQRLRR